METAKITFEIPLAPFDSETEDLLNEQVEQFVKQFRGILSVYKEAGISVPTVAFRATKKKKESTETGYKEFAKTLLNHHLKYMPKDNSVQQRTVIKQLYGTGMSADECIELYEESKREYAMTSWLTVRYKLNKSNVESSPETVKLSEEQKESIIARYVKKPVGKND